MNTERSDKVRMTIDAFDTGVVTDEQTRDSVRHQMGERDMYVPVTLTRGQWSGIANDVSTVIGDATETEIDTDNRLSRLSWVRSDIGIVLGQ